MSHFSLKMCLKHVIFKKFYFLFRQQQVYHSIIAFSELNYCVINVFQLLNLLMK